VDIIRTSVGSRRMRAPVSSLARINCTTIDSL
jgi:hypothetical protein